MTISNDGTSFRERLNVNQPNTVADKLCLIYLGAVLRALTTHLFGKVPAANAGNLATLHSIELNEFGKAASLKRAYARAGTVTGELTMVAFGATPTTGQVAVAPNGDIVVLAADAITLLDVIYQPLKYDLTEITFPVASNALALPASLTSRGIVSVFEVEATKGTAPGKKIILVPGTAPAAGQARLNVAKTQILFQATDAVTEARVKLGFAPAYDLDAELVGTSPVY